MIVELTKEFHNRVLNWQKVLETGLVGQTSRWIIPSNVELITSVDSTYNYVSAVLYVMGSGRPFCDWQLLAGYYLLILSLKPNPERNAFSISSHTQLNLARFNVLYFTDSKMPLIIRCPLFYGLLRKNNADKLWNNARKLWNNTRMYPLSEVHLRFDNKKYYSFTLK